MESDTAFEWLSEYDDLLQQIASTDLVDAEWTQLRDIIKYKLAKNIEMYLSEGGKRPSPPITISAPRSLPNGGLKLPPFPLWPRSDANPNGPSPKIILTEKEANDFKEIIYEQLNGFEGSPPFSIQRVCELCLNPKQHYKYLGKYLRAVEKSLLVTSTWDTFPALTEKERTYSAATQAPIATSSSTPNTPIFSPIPFLHEDARSSSRSPPPSPLSLPAAAGGSVMGPETKALGLVDELDDPGPGHLSDHPHPLSATTTMSTRSFRGSLEERFIRAREEDTEGRQPQMEDDEELMDEDKENKA